MSTPYFQSMYSPQQQVIFPGNLTLHTGTSPMVQSITQNPNVQLQAKPELLNKVSVTGPTYQIVNAVTTKVNIFFVQSLLMSVTLHCVTLYNKHHLEIVYTNSSLCFK